MRTLRVTTPIIKGTDVKALQKSINARLHARHSTGMLKVDGEFGAKTLRSAQKAGFLLGAPDSWIRGNAVGSSLQTIIERPSTRNGFQLRRAKRRWKRVLALRKKRQRGARGALKLAKSLVGVSEHPPGSNRGPKIDAWNRDVGTPPGPEAYWCGAFVHHLLRSVGFPRMTWMAYCPYIEQRAKAGFDGWKWHGPEVKAKPGWLALFDEGGVAGHVEMVEEDNDNAITDYGGNTDTEDIGSQSNGGCVAHRHRYKKGGFPVRGYAEPPYSRYS